jgi:hypothetical protein
MRELIALFIFNWTNRRAQKPLEPHQWICGRMRDVCNQHLAMGEAVRPPAGIHLDPLVDRIKAKLSAAFGPEKETWHA